MEQRRVHQGADRRIIRKSGLSHCGAVTVTMLSLYVSQRVKELTAGLQTPVATLPPAFADFPLASTAP